MKVTPQLRKKIAREVHDDYNSKTGLDSTYTRTRHANYLGISPALHSQVLKGHTEHLLADDKWLNMARKLDIDLSGQNWKICKTATYNFMYPQMEHCKKHGVARIFSDLIGIGKTATAVSFMKQHPNVSYVNCKHATSAKEMIQAIGKGFGFTVYGTLSACRRKLIDSISVLHEPLVILDDAGYLNNKAILESIGLWDSLEQMCGWYYVGEPAFRAKFERQIELNKLGYEAWFSRNGNRVMSVTEDLTDAQVAALKRKQCEQVLSVNYKEGYANKNTRTDLLHNSMLNLRTLREDIVKAKNSTKK